MKANRRMPTAVLFQSQSLVFLTSLDQFLLVSMVCHRRNFILDHLLSEATNTSFLQDSMVLHREISFNSGRTSDPTGGWSLGLFLLQPLPWRNR